MNIAGVEVGPGQPCRVVAEIGANHNGDLALCKQLVIDAAEAGADIVKFQAYLPAELLALRGGDGPAPEPWAGQTLGELYAKAQTPLKWFPELIALCNDQEQPWYASVFGLGSLAFMEAMDCPAYKLGALDYKRKKFASQVRATGKPIVRSTPGPRSRDFELWCPPGYPQAPVPMKQVRKYEGFSYHGIDPFIPALAAMHGAQMVEAHVQLDGEFGPESGLDAHSSLDMGAFASLVQMVQAGAAWS